MTRASTTGRRPEGALYRRHAAVLTAVPVLHPTEKAAAVAAIPFHRRRARRLELEGAWEVEEAQARLEAIDVLADLAGTAAALADGLDRIAALRRRDLLGAVEAEQGRLRTVRTRLDSAGEALDRGDFGAAGTAAEDAERELWQVGSSLVGSLNQALAAVTVGREQRARLEANLAERRQARRGLQRDRGDHADPRAAAAAAAAFHRLTADGLGLAAEVLGARATASETAARKARVSRDGELLVVPPGECESFAEVGGLVEAKERLRQTVGSLLERPDAAARYQVEHNGVIFHGPPGTGKTLLSRALAGEYGLRYIRFTPASIASRYLHEASINLRRVFELARDNVPCLLFLDEIDTIAGDRGEPGSPDRVEVVTQLMICLEEFRNTPGLLIAAATNAVDRLDPGLREGRFDIRVAVRLPDPAARADILRVHLRRRQDTVEWDGLDLDALARMTAGHNGAALERVVSLAAQRALHESRTITHADLVAAVQDRAGREHIDLDETLTWEDVVLADETREQLMEVLNVFANPELARELGVKPPAGVLLHGPPGTGKTATAKAIAAEASASFYELSAAELISKWLGESEQRVAKLFARARAHQPAIIFIDEIDALLRRRSEGAMLSEERVVSQFLQELDGLRSGDGVLLIGATNRLDMVDEAAVGRRLIPVEVTLPDSVMRLRLLQLLCRDVRLADDVNLRAIASATGGMSGADLRRVRDGAGMKALSRVARSGAGPRDVAITMADFQAALEGQRGRASLAVI